MRAAWIAAVANLDWPSTNAVTSAQQKAELLAILDRAAQLKLNAVLFQVRPACDAMYPSPFEPWSEYLTGAMGKAPEPYYDPLAFAIEEAHKRGLELHAWFNPFRARHVIARSAISSNHISKTHPEYVRAIGKYLWLDPGEPKVQAYSLKVVLDVVRRYDIDGVHFDDYFYPDRKDSGADRDFPDEASWRRYGASGNLSKEDWRRENINRFIRQTGEAIKAVKPWVKFGISPFGIWRPKNPPQIKGMDAYQERFADSRLWLAGGWVDYFAPQLYWRIEPPDQSFPALLNWWAGQNPRGRVLCPGLNTFNVDHGWKIDEILNQIRLERKQTGASGQIHWRMSVLMRNTALASALERSVYFQPALMPAFTWLGGAAPAKPKFHAGTDEKGARLIFRWNADEPQKPWLWVLQTRTRGDWTTQVLPASTGAFLWRSRFLPEFASLAAVDRLGNASPPAVLERGSRAKE